MRYEWLVGSNRLCKENSVTTTRAVREERIVSVKKTFLSLKCLRSFLEGHDQTLSIVLSYK